MTSSYLRSLVGAGNGILPDIKRNRPYIYWHFRTCIIEAELGNEAAARELVEQITQIIEETIEACLKNGERSRARALTCVKENILEGVNS